MLFFLLIILSTALAQTWQPISGDWIVNQNSLEQNKISTVASQIKYLPETYICDFDLKLNFTNTEGSFTSILVFFRTQDEFMKNGYLIFVEGDKLAIAKYTNGQYVEKASKIISTQLDTNYRLELSTNKGEIQASLNNEQITANIGTDFYCGFIGLGNDHSKIKIENPSINITIPQKMQIQKTQDTAQSTKYIITLPGDSNWTKTGIILDKNQKIKITAKGQIDYCAPNGCYTGPEGGTNIIKTPDNPLCSTARDISLIGKIEDNNCFEIGTIEEFTTDTNGELELAINDGYLPGNTGYLIINIDINKGTNPQNPINNQNLIPNIANNPPAQKSQTITTSTSNNINSNNNLFDKIASNLFLAVILGALLWFVVHSSKENNKRKQMIEAHNNKINKTLEEIEAIKPIIGKTKNEAILENIAQGIEETKLKETANIEEIDLNKKRREAHYAHLKELEKIEKINKKEAERLEHSKDYILIERFAKQFGENYSNTNLNSLLGVIAKRGYATTTTELSSLVQQELINQEYDLFKKKMHSKRPKKYEDYAKYFLEIYGENYEEYQNFFEDLLNEKKIKHDTTKTISNLEKIKTEIDEKLFEEKLLHNKEARINFSEITTLSGHEFESFLEKLFTKMGYKAIKTKGSGDQGADLLIEKFGEKTVVQAKNYTEKVSNGAVQEVVAAIKHYKADKGMVVTTNYFQPSAHELAKSNNIQLIDRNQLKKWIEKYL
jgi:hypothetical protein